MREEEEAEKEEKGRQREALEELKEEGRQRVGFQSDAADGGVPKLLKTLLICKTLSNEDLDEPRKVVLYHHPHPA